MARPKIPINEEQVEALAAKFWSKKQIAAFFRVSEDTIERRFADQIEQAKQRGGAKLLDIAWQRVEGGSDKMLLAMLEKYCDFKVPEKVEHGGGIEVVITDYREKKS